MAAVARTLSSRRTAMTPPPDRRDDAAELCNHRRGADVHALHALGLGDVHRNAVCDDSGVIEIVTSAVPREPWTLP